MKQALIYILLFSTFLFGCKENKMQLITGSWRAVKYQNHKMDSILTNGQAFIDTMGKNHDDSTNMHIYGVSNMDSIRQLMQQKHDEAVSEQNEQVKNTVFTFRKDGMAIINLGGRIDSSKWTMDNENNLIIETLDTASPGQILKWQIVYLTKSSLTLKFKENNDSTLVTFKPEGK